MLATILLTALALGQPVTLAAEPDAPLQVLQAGDSSAARGTVVLVPGLTGCAWGYRHVVAGLNAAGCRVVVIEPLGVGASARPAHGDYSLTAQADRLAAVMDTLATGPGVIVAHGVSASMAMRLAVRRPDLVRGLVSIEGGPDESSLTPTVERTLGLVSLAAKLGAERLVRDRFGASLAAASGDRGWIDGVAVRRYFQGPGRDLDATVTALRAMADAVEPESLRAHLPLLARPVVLLLGGAGHEGRPAAADVELMQRTLPDCRVREVPGAGHYLFEEQPAVVVRAVLELVDETAAAGTAQTATVAAAVTGGASCAR